MQGRLIRFRLRRSQVPDARQIWGERAVKQFEIAGVDKTDFRSRQSRQRIEHGPKGQHSQEERVPCGAVSAPSGNSMQWLCFRGAHPPAYVTRIPGIYRGGRHVVNRAHRRTISAAPQDVSQSRRNSNVGCCSGSLGGCHVRSISDHTPLRCQQ